MTNYEKLQYTSDRDDPPGAILGLNVLLTGKMIITQGLWITLKLEGFHILFSGYY